MKWDEWTKFKLETIRMTALAMIGGLAAIWILDPAKKELEYSAELDKTKLAIRAKVVDEFLAATYRYTSITYDVCSGDESQTKVWDESFNLMRSTRNRLDIYFSDNTDMHALLLSLDKMGEHLRQVRQASPSRPSECGLSDCPTLGSHPVTDLQAPQGN